MDVIKLFQKLLQFRSITPSDDGAFDFIEDYLGETWKCINIDINNTKNRFFYKTCNNNTNHLCFAGHIDVVPPGDGWDNDPFIPIIANGMITARGAQDMKSGVAAFLYACKNTVEFNGTLSILLTSDEEGDAKDGTVKALEYLKTINFLPTSAVVAEPTCEKEFGDAIKIGRRGSINGYLSIQGKQGHAAYPEKTINPIELIAPVLNHIAGINLDDGDKYFAPSKLILTDIRAGMEVTNVTPNKLNLMFNVRNSTNTNQENIKDFISKHFQNIPFELKLTQGSYPFMTDSHSTIVQILTSAINECLNIQTKHSTAGGTSDARFFGQFKIPTVEFGVINDTIHSINERTSIKEVEGLTNVFQKVIEKF